MTEPVRLLMVCLGNICRSPMAEGAFRYRLAEAGLEKAVEVDSVGTGPWHVGDPPDSRAIATAKTYGVDISGLRGRQLGEADFERFDWLLCADAQNLRDAQRRLPRKNCKAGIELLLPWAGIQTAKVVPDPYTGNADDFHHVWQLVDAAAQAAIRHRAWSRRISA